MHHRALEGPKAAQRAKTAIWSITVPELRTAGFEGSFPKYRRIDDDRHAVVWFNWGRAGGFVTVGLAVVPPRRGATVVEDYRRAVNVRNRQRTTLSNLLSAKWIKLPFFDEAHAMWGDVWPEALAHLLSERLEAEGVRWLGSMARRPKRKKGVPR